MARASYVASARAMAHTLTNWPGFAPPQWPTFAPPLTPIMANINERGVSRLFAVSSFILICVPLFAEPYSTIQTPPASAIASISNDETLHQLVLANLIASNCKIPDLTSGDAALLAGTAQTVAEYMKVSTDQYFSDYVHPAMAKLATPDSCNQFAGTARDMLEHLKGLGGAIIAE